MAFAGFSLTLFKQISAAGALVKAIPDESGPAVTTAQVKAFSHLFRLATGGSAGLPQ
jgi:hypothetical protein